MAKPGLLAKPLLLNLLTVTSQRTALGKAEDLGTFFTFAGLLTGEEKFSAKAYSPQSGSQSRK